MSTKRRPRNEDREAIRIMYTALLQVGMVLFAPDTTLIEEKSVMFGRAIAQNMRAREIVDAMLTKMNSEYTRVVQEALGLGEK